MKNKRLFLKIDVIEGRKDGEFCVVMEDSPSFRQLLNVSV